MKFNNKILIFILFTSQCSNHIFSQSKKSNPFFAENNRLKFGNYLFLQKDYLRAIDEFKAYLSVTQNDTVKFKIAFGYSEMGNSLLAENNFRELFNSRNLNSYSKIYFAREKLIIENFQYFNTETKVLSHSQLSKASFIYRNNFQMMRNFAVLLNGKTHQNSASFLQPFPSNIKEEAERFYLRKEFSVYKNSTTAGILSAIIPGSGKIYVEKTGDGITAFVVTGLLTFLAVDNFKADHQMRAWLFTGLASAFYAGNIYGSVMAAQQYNLGIQISFGKDVKAFFKKHNFFAPIPKFLFN